MCVCVFWPTASEPCPSYEVVGFQPQEVDTPYIGSVHTFSAFSIPPTSTMHAIDDNK